MRTLTEGTAKPRAPLQSRILCQACAASAFFCRPGSGARSVGRRTVPSSNPAPRAYACLGLDCHEFSSAPSHAQACKRLVVAAVVYGYDRDTLRRRPTTRRATTVIRFDDAQRHDARRRHARHPPHPDDNTRPNVRRKRRLRAQLPKPVYLFQRPQTCNRCETNPSR